MNPNILLNRPAIRGHELRNGIEAFAHHVCSGLKLRPVTIEWTPGTSTAAISSIGIMYLAAVRDDALIKRSDVLKYLGFVVHELLHRKYTNFRIRPSYSDPSDLRVYHNAIEDAWIERTAIRSGLLGNIEALLQGLLRGMTDRARAEVQDWTHPGQYPFALAVTCRAYPGISVPLAAGLEPIFAEASRRIDYCQDSSDTLTLARWVLDQLKNLPQQQQEPGQQQEQPGQEPGEGEKSGDDSAPGTGEAGQEPGEEPGQGTQQGEQSGAGEPGEEPGQGEQDGNAPGDKPGEGEQSGQGENPGPARPATGDDSPREVEATIEAPDQTGSIGTFNRASSIRRPGSHLAGCSLHSIKTINAPRLELEVRRMFEDSASTLFTGGRKSGSINVSALGRFGTTERLFKQRKDIEGIDSAVVIVLDVSGSMFQRSERIDAALATASLLIRVLHRAGVAVAVTTFGDDSSVTVPFSTPTPKALDILSRVTSDGSTNDFAALKFSHDLLLSRPEARKVCFVLTDGRGNRGAAREQVNAGTNLGITTIGIGMELNVSDVYPINLHVENLNSLATASLRQIKIAA